MLCFRTEIFIVMDVYQLIYERGLIGALEYANQIDKQNYKLASEIDLAINSLIRTATNVGNKNVRKAQFEELGGFELPQRQYYAPARQTEIPSPEPTQDPAQQEAAQFKRNNPAGFGAAAVGGYIFLNQVQAAKYFKKYWYTQGQLDTFTDIASKIRAGSATPAEIENASKILAKVPRYATKINGTDVALIDRYIDILKNTGNSPVISEILQTSGTWSSQPTMSARQRLMDVVRPGWGSSSFQSKLQNWVHPIFDKFDPGLTPAQNRKVLDLIKGKAPDEALDALKAFDAAQGTSAAAKLESHLISNAGVDSVAEALGKLKGGTAAGKAKAAVGEGPLTEIFSKLIQKFPAIAGPLKFLLKWAGPIAVAFEAKGLFDEYNEFGPSPRFYCKALSTIVGAISLIPPATPFAGPLWIALQFGCNLFSGGEKKKDDSKVTQSDIDSRESSIQWNDLSDGDKQAVKDILKRSDEGAASWQNLFINGMTNKQFDNAADVGAALQKQRNQGNFVE